MAKNVGGTERIARIVAGTGLIVLGLIADRAALRGLALLAGGELLYTAATRYCPANDALGRDTAPLDEGADIGELPA